MGGEQIQHSPVSSGTNQEAEIVPVVPEQATNQELAAATDAMLDEIDSILETNAEQFVAGYQQRGGQ